MSLLARKIRLLTGKNPALSYSVYVYWRHGSYGSNFVNFRPSKLFKHLLLKVFM